MTRTTSRRPGSIGTDSTSGELRSSIRASAASASVPPSSVTWRMRSTAWRRSPASAPPGLRAALIASSPVASSTRSTAAGAGSRRVQSYMRRIPRSASPTGPATASRSGAVRRNPPPASRWRKSAASLSPNSGPRSTPTTAGPSSGSVSAHSRCASPVTASDCAKAAPPLTSTGSRRLSSARV